MRGRTVQLAAAVTLFTVLFPSACSSTRAVTSSGSLTGEQASDGAKGAETVTGRGVTMDVPHSAGTIRDIKEREAKEPLPPRGDVAIPSHRILRGDNTVAPTPPAGAPAGNDNPGERTPGKTGGY